MQLLGSERVVTQDYKTHGYAEDYAGEHLSNIKINGTAKVTKVINKYVTYEDAINYDEYLKNREAWKDGTYYNCISITGKIVRYHQSELGGNQIELECYEGNSKRHIRLAHMADVLVKVGDIIDAETIIGKQGNTGLVLSKRAIEDVSYGSHVHMEVLDDNYHSLDPREYATFLKVINYIEQTNPIDNTKKQIKIIVDSINIRLNQSKNSASLGKVYSDEIYNVLDVSEDEEYTWYHIQTSLGVNGYVANEKGKNWLVVTKENEDMETQVKAADEIKELKLIFTCEKDGMYAVKLKLGERLYVE